jgi:hypothetical protein
MASQLAGYRSADGPGHVALRLVGWLVSRALRARVVARSWVGAFVAWGHRYVGGGGTNGVSGAFPPRRPFFVAIATSDGQALNATLDAASSFVLFELSGASLSYVALLGCAFADPGGRSARARRRAALRGVDLVVALDSGTRAGNRAPRGARLVFARRPIPLARLTHAADLVLALELG